MNTTTTSHRKPHAMKETPKAARAFEQYYQMGEDRTLAALAGKLHQEARRAAGEAKQAGTPGQNQDATGALPSEAAILSQLKKWSATHDWQERVIARDAAAYERDRRKRERAIEKMNEEHALLGRTQALRAVRQIEHLIEIQKFGSMAAVSLFKAATDLERLARGAATERAEHTGVDGGPIGVQVGFYPVELPQKRPILPREGEPEPETAAPREGAAPLSPPAPATGFVLPRKGQDEKGGE